jgi:hypothetical protein
LYTANKVDNCGCALTRGTMMDDGVFVDLINNLQGEAEESREEIIGMLESRSREYSVLNDLMNKYIDRCDAADILMKESKSRRE